jgi:sec-independent protein translocase protein TatB
MPGISWTELLLIGVVALIVIGPKELPAVMRKIGQFARTVRRMGQDFQRELNKTTGLNEIRNLRESVSQPLKATADAIRKEFNTTSPTDEVTPSGALKPADPKAGSVVNEIKAAAGLPLTAAAAAAQAKAATADAPHTVTKKAKTPVRAVRPTKINAPAESMVEVTGIVPVKKPGKPRDTKSVEAAAPAEAVTPTKTPAARRPSTKNLDPPASPGITPVEAAPAAAPARKSATPASKAAVPARKSTEPATEAVAAPGRKAALKPASKSAANKEAT